VTRRRTAGATSAISVRLGAAEIAAIDAAATRDDLGRADWIRAVCRIALRDERIRQEIRYAVALVMLEPPR
jgi:hypothetical protein